MRTPLYTYRVDVVSSTVTIIGRAFAGADESDPVWRLTQITNDGFGHVSIKTVNGLTGFNYSWTDRNSYSFM